MDPIVQTWLRPVRFSDVAFTVGGFRYATLYFEADGFHASQIGVLIAVRRALQTLGTPLWNAMADKTKKARMGI